jgi:hypothetical protein
MKDAIQHGCRITIAELAHKPQIQFAERPAAKPLFRFQTSDGLFAQNGRENAYLAIYAFCNFVRFLKIRPPF